MSNIPAGYKHTEVGVIPEDWEVVHLSELGKFKNGINKSSEAFGHGSPFVNLMDVFGVSSIALSDALGLVDSNNAEQQTYDLRKGDVIFIRSSVKPSGVGLTAVVEEDLPKTVYSGFLIRFRDSGALDNGFKRHCFYQEGFRKRVISGSSVSANTNINQDNLKRLLIAIPPTKAEQTAIAAALSDADALITSLEKLIAKKQNIKQGAMQELLKPKEGWVVKKLGEVFSFSGGYSASREQLSNDGFCYLHYGDIHGAKKTFINVKNEYTEIPKLKISLKNISPKSLLNEGDIVFVDASEDDEGTSRHIVVKNPDGVPYISGLHTIVAKSIDDSVNNDYKRYCFQSAYIKSQFKFYAVGTKVSGISKTNIAKIEIAFPTSDEQTRIATILSDMDAEIEGLEKKLDKYRRIKQGMMQELLTGKTRLS